MDCVRCGKPIPLDRVYGPWGANIKYCSVQCRDVPMYPRKVREVPLPTGTVGAISELLVAADLMELGWHVYRAMSPAASCDLIATGNGLTHRVEVRTGFMRKGGVCISYTDTDIGRHDCVAVVMDEGEIIYVPDLFRGSGWSTLERMVDSVVNRMSRLRETQDDVAS